MSDQEPKPVDPEAEALMAKFSEASKKNYKQQGIFYLNAYWTEFGAHAEKVWEYAHGFAKIDPLKDAGSELDEVQAHIFLEKFEKPMTALELRESLRSIDLNSNRKMSLLEFLIYKIGGDIKNLVSRPQGTIERFTEEFIQHEHKAQVDEQLENVKKSFHSSNERLLSAQESLQKCLTEIRKLEAEIAMYSEQAAGQGIKALKAQTMLNKLMNAGDHQDALNEAVIHAEAAVRKVKPAALAAKKALQEYMETHGPPDEDRVEIEVKRSVEVEFHDQGDVWWVERELEEIKKYKPNTKLWH
jgi:hypothetical protein